MNYSKFLCFLTAILLTGIAGNAQESLQKRHLSINANEFVNVFTDQVNTLDLTFRVMAIDTSHSLRIATSFGMSSVEEEISGFALRIGIDNVFKETKHWKFYTGVDAEYGYAKVNDRETSSTTYGLIGFVGFLYQFGPHFSLSTEPSIGIFRETQSFSFRDDISSTRFSPVKLGQIKVGFHF